MIAASPVPNANAGIAEMNGIRKREPLELRLLTSHNDVDEVSAPQASVSRHKQRIRIGRQIDSDHLRLLIRNKVDKAWILVAEAVVVLAPNMRAEEVIQGGDRSAPGNLRTRNIQPLGVLVEHRIDDVNKCLIA